MTELIRLLELHLQRPARVHHSATSPGDVPSTRAEAADLRRLVPGVHPPPPLEQGLRHFVDWYPRLARDRGPVPAAAGGSSGLTVPASDPSTGPARPSRSRATSAACRAPACRHRSGRTRTAAASSSPVTTATSTPSRAAVASVRRLTATSPRALVGRRPGHPGAGLEQVALHLLDQPRGTLQPPLDPLRLGKGGPDLS